MNSIEERAKGLASLLAFDSDAFRGDDEVPQELCDVVLAFAIVFNDCRDILLWHVELTAGLTPPPQPLNRASGEQGGVITHTTRLLVAILHELGELVRKNGKVLHDPFFEQKVLPKLDKEQRIRWERLRDLAQGKSPAKSMDDYLDFLRNKATYHYDAEDLRPGYERCFPHGSEKPREQPLVSIARDLRSTRFYFGDATAYNVLEHSAAERELVPLGPPLSAALADLMVTLAKIVEIFIQARKPWREFKEETP
jgi:hypothetical protein